MEKPSFLGSGILGDVLQLPCFINDNVLWTWISTSSPRKFALPGCCCWMLPWFLKYGSQDGIHGVFFVFSGFLAVEFQRNTSQVPNYINYSCLFEVMFIFYHGKSPIFHHHLGNIFYLFQTLNKQI